jgi:hypothetical protein
MPACILVKGIRLPAQAQPFQHVGSTAPAKDLQNMLIKKVKEKEKRNKEEHDYIKAKN